MVLVSVLLHVIRKPYTFPWFPWLLKLYDVHVWEYIYVEREREREWDNKELINTKGDLCSLFIVSNLESFSLRRKIENSLGIRKVLKDKFRIQVLNTDDFVTITKAFKSFS